MSTDPLPEDVAPYYRDEQVTLHHGDALKVLRSLTDGSVDCVVTSPPYFGLRDYGVEGQYGLEESPSAYVETMRAVFSEARRVLAGDGTLWLNLGDSYASHPNGNVPNAQTLHQQGGRRPTTKYAKGMGQSPYGVPPKNLLGIPWRVAFALQEDGWILRSDIIWSKPNSMPENVKDRPSSAHEHVFLLTKSRRYHYDGDAIAEQATGQASGNGFRREHGLSRDVRGTEEAWQGRPQLRRALELAREKGLTEAHFTAIRAVGMSDAGKAREIQGGSGRNTAEAQRLADEAKAALGGYYREFLTGATRNARNVWEIAPQPFAEAHFACMPMALAERSVMAGCRPGGVVLDPFSGSGTTGAAATKHGRRYVGIDLNADYLDLSLRTRLGQASITDGVA